MIPGDWKIAIAHPAANLPRIGRPVSPSIAVVVSLGSQSLEGSSDCWLARVPTSEIPFVTVLNQTLSIWWKTQPHKMRLPATKHDGPVSASDARLNRQHVKDTHHITICPSSATAPIMKFISRYTTFYSVNKSLQT